MSRPTIAFAVACSLTLGVVAAAAQSPSSGGSLSIAVGVGRSARSDAAVSPDRFDGFGPDVALAYRARAGRADLRVGAAAALRSLGAGGAGASTERTTQAELDVAAFAAHDSDASALQLGLDGRVSGALIEHRFAGASSSPFAFAAATLGPVAAWSRAARAGVVELTVATPVVGLVMQPYETLRAVSPAPTMRTATIASLQAIQASLHYDPPARRAARGSRFDYQYRISVLRYGGDSPIRELTQTLSVGIAWGGRSR